MDHLSPDRRSWNMSRIRSKDTTPERIVRSFLHRNGLRFRLHVKDLPGTPDIVLPKYKTVIDVRGCYWHQHKGCRMATMPSTNVGFWHKKLKCNVDRDRKNRAELKRLGWHVIVIWECQTVKDKFPPRILAEFIKKNSTRSSLFLRTEALEATTAGCFVKGSPFIYNHLQS